jgi:hypothetical protein
MSELEQFCDELYDALEFIDEYFERLSNGHWDKHDEREFHGRVQDLSLYRARLGEILYNSLNN